MTNTRAKTGIGTVTSSGLPWAARRIKQAAGWIQEGKDYAPATVVRMLRESRGNMQDFWFAWSELLDVACDKFDWSEPVVLDRDQVERYESGEDFYCREVEPFLGPLERLRQVAGRYRKGEITHDEGRDELCQRALTTKDNQQGKRNDLTSTNFVEVGSTNANKNVLRRLARDHIDLFERVRRGELSVNAAAIQAGIRKKPSPEEQCCKWFKKCDDKAAVLRRLQEYLEVAHERL